MTHLFLFSLLLFLPPSFIHLIPNKRSQPDEVLDRKDRGTNIQNTMATTTTDCAPPRSPSPKKKGKLHNPKP